MSDTTKLHKQVIAFMSASGQHISDRPEIATDAVLRLRARLILEEAFEYAEATVGLTYSATQLVELKKKAFDLIDGAVPCPDLVNMADALADIDYVVEGARITLGIDGVPIADEVHRTNMTKMAGPVVNGKKMKPEGWLLPDIRTELIKQGWVPKP